MKIEIKSLNLINFKGIKQLMIKFDHETNISGGNATGKTTIFDAFLWVLFGKDSTDRKDFGIKTLDETGHEIPMIDHEVLAQLMIDDRSLILRRIYKEKWVKPRGQAKEVFSGNETVFYADGVPCSQKEYQEKVESLCKEAIFKLLTNPHYFPNLNWTIQRGALFSLTQEATNEEIVAVIPKSALKQGNFEELTRVLESDMTLEKYKTKLASEIKNIQDELVLIPARIDEVFRGRPEPEDWENLEKTIKDAEAFILRKEGEKTDRGKSVESETLKRAELKGKINSVKQKIEDIDIRIQDLVKIATRESQTQIQASKSLIIDYEGLMKRNTNNLSGFRLDMEDLNGKREKLIDEWNYLNAEQYTHVVPGTCSECGQKLPEDFREKTHQENLTEWNNNKRAKLNDNVQKGKNLKIQIEQKQEAIDGLVQSNERLQGDLDKVNQNLQEIEANKVPTVLEMTASNEEYPKLRAELDVLTKKYEKLGDIKPVDVSDLNKEITFARANIDENKPKLAKREQIALADKRKGELEESQTKMSQQIAELEQIQYSIEVFLRTKVRMLEEKINGLFGLVKFKMFDLQVNGQLAETCECSVDGVPYGDLNNAAKINAGIDIINTMSAHHGIVAPIFIDNRESVNELIATKAQLINLYVIPEVPEDKEEKERYIKEYSERGILLIDKLNH